jgi:hypothetical protein
LVPPGTTLWLDAREEKGLRPRIKIMVLYGTSVGRRR